MSKLRNTEFLRRYSYRADGLATIHHSPFLEDAEFSRLYDGMAPHWLTSARIDPRWRVWLLTRLARSCRHLPGNFAECGSYRGGHAFMILSTASLDPARKFFLFDTFAGLPTERLSSDESHHGYAGLYSNTSVEYVGDVLSAWRAQVEICPGDVFDSLATVETGDLAFAHNDLNATAPTIRALEYTYDRLVPGGMVVFDDYGYAGFDAQRIAIDEFFAEREEEVIGLPTGQGFVTKR